MKEEEQRGEEIEEWDFFPRIERLEKMTQDYLASGQKVARDNTIVSRVALMLAFTTRFMHSPKRARRFKDAMIEYMKQENLSGEALERIEKILQGMCDTFEEST